MPSWWHKRCKSLMGTAISFRNGDGLQRNPAEYHPLWRVEPLCALASSRSPGHGAVRSTAGPPSPPSPPPLRFPSCDRLGLGFSMALPLFDAPMARPPPPPLPLLLPRLRTIRARPRKPSLRPSPVSRPTPSPIPFIRFNRYPVIFCAR